MCVVVVVCGGGCDAGGCIVDGYGYMLVFVCLLMFLCVFV